MIHTKSAQERLISEVFGVLTRFRSSNIIFVLPSDSSETNIPAGDTATKVPPSTQKYTSHTLQNIKHNYIHKSYLKPI